MSSYVFHDASGRVTKCMSCRATTAALNLRDGETCIERAWVDGATQYIVDGEPVPRPPNPAAINKTQLDADGADEAVLTGIPIGSTVDILGPVTSSTQVDDGDLEITVDVPGVYRITVQSFPELDKEFTLVAT